jgi:hypothetical protein
LELGTDEDDGGRTGGLGNAFDGRRGEEVRGGGVAGGAYRRGEKPTEDNGEFCDTGMKGE